MSELTKVNAVADFLKKIWNFILTIWNFLFNRKLKGIDELIDKVTPVFHADMLCLEKTDREKILEQLGIDKENFANGFKAKSMSELWSIELLTISKLKPDDLVARLCTVRQKFRSLVGEDVYKNYISSLADNLTEENVKKLEDINNKKAITDAICGDISNLVRQIQRINYYKFLCLHNIHEVKEKILFSLFVVLLLMFGSVFLLYGYDPVPLYLKHYSLVVTTIFSGMVGSCMSLLQRTEKANNASMSFTNSIFDAMEIKGSMSNGYIVSLILSGAIFATILYLLAVSNSLVLGDLFPKLELLATKEYLAANKSPLPTELNFCKYEVGIRALFGCVEFNPKNAMMLVWAFMAGFAERLVPDALDSLTQKAQKPKT